MMKYWLSVNWRNWNVMKVTLAMFYNLYSAEALFRAGLGLSWVSVTILTLTVSLNALFRASLLSVVHWWLVGGIVSDMWECICPRCGFSNSFNRFCLLVNQIWLILSLLVLFFEALTGMIPLKHFQSPLPMASPWKRLLKCLVRYGRLHCPSVFQQLARVYTDQVRFFKPFLLVLLASQLGFVRRLSQIYPFSKPVPTVPLLRQSVVSLEMYA